MSGFEIGVETITPEIAANWLKRNTSNRAMRSSRVDELARQMQAGGWGLTHQGVAFNGDGTLLDGQHRLAAIVKAGVSVRMVVTRGVKREMQLFMDDHARRTASDSLSLHRQEKITSTDIAIIRAATSLSQTQLTRHFSKAELDEALDLFSSALSFCHKYTHGVDRQRGVAAAPVWGAVALAWFYVDDTHRLIEFCEILVGREMAKDEFNNSAQMLREWLLRTGVSAGPSRIEAFKKTQRAIVAFMQRKPLQKLYGTDHYYPFPLIDPVRVQNKETMK